MLFLALLLSAWPAAVRLLAVPAEDGFSVQSWQIEHGLPQNSVRAIAQTPDGYLWLGTYDGVVRFDGLRFTTFTPRNSPGLKSQRIYGLAVDGDGALWMATDGGGVARYRDGQFRSFTTAEGLAGNIVHSICVDADGAVWAGGDMGLNRIRGDRIIPVEPATGSLSKNLWRLKTDRSGRPWVMFQESGLQWVTPAGLERRPAVEGFTGAWFSTCFEDSGGNRWAAAVRGDLVRWSGGNAQIFKRGRDISNADIWDITEDTTGNVWFSTAGDGLWRYHEGQFTRLGLEAGLSSLHLRTMLVDREGNLWVGSENGGLNRVRRKLFQTYHEGHGLPTAAMASILERRDGEGLWVANSCHGVFIFEDGRFRAGPAVNDCPISLLWTRAGELWVGNFVNGFSILRGDQLENVRTLSKTTVRSLVEDPGGVIWIGGSAGIHRWDQGKLTMLTAADGLYGSHFGGLVVDRKGAVWAGSRESGAYRIEGKCLTRFTTKDGLGSDAVATLHCDEEGTLWAGTSGGLSRFDGARFRTLTSGQGLEPNAVNQIIDDGLGYLWIAGNRGLFRIERRELNACFAGTVPAVRPVAFGKADGLPSLESTSGSHPNCARTRDGRLWFLMLQGLVSIDPRTLAPDRLPPPVALERVMVDGRDLALPVSGSARKSPGVVVPPGAARLEFHYAGLSFATPERVRYRYRMKGFEQQWADAGTQRSVQYTRLRPGNYEFQVLAASADGVWNESGASLALTVQPRFTQTIGFKALCGLALVAGVFGVSQRRVWQLEKRRRAQEAFARQLLDSQEQERKRIAGELHDSLSQDLQLIKNRAHLALNYLAPASELQAQLTEISAISARAIAGTRAISHALRPPEIEHFGLTRAIELMVERVAQSAGFPAAAELECIDGFFSDEQQLNIYRVLQECLNNVVKHAQPTRVIVTIQKQERSIEISVFDNGRGFVTGAGGGPAGPAHASLGLKSMQERARILGGRLEIQSALGTGTRVTLVVPVNDRLRADGGSAASRANGSADQGAYAR